MAKYDPLKRFLIGCHQARVSMSFSEISELVGGLPRSAFDYQAWWSNEVNPRMHVQKQAWMNAGYMVERADRSSRTVTFITR